MTAGPRTIALVDEFLPVFDVSDTVALVVHASVGHTWRALLDVDLIDLGRRQPAVAVLGGLRALPSIVSELLHGERPSMPQSMRLRDAAAVPPEQGGWVLLGERENDEIALGMVGKLWRPVIEYADVPREAFREFAEPGYAKTVYALSVRPIDGTRTLLTGVMRTATTDAHARAWFRRYWTLGVGSGAHVLVQHLLDTVAADAETRAGDDAFHEDA
jgi:hypothetical protein